MTHMSLPERVRLVAVALVMALVSLTQNVSAFTIRYALVIGNNIGVDGDGNQPYPPLKHAEQEARELKRQLVGLSNFDASSERTRLLTGATREEVMAAFDSLKAQKARDEAVLGDVDSIFLLYYTGHGLEGRLLMQDGPISSATLATLFNKMGADFSVGVFDACYSGSLDSVLSEKGISPTPGLNIVREMPSEVLSAKGSVWFVSSGAGEASYEDKQLGGVFTHFFTEALAKAKTKGPGITLDQIWQYARDRTIAYTSERDRRQVPEQLIANLRVKAPVYFSFPIERNATLVLAESVFGKFAVAYADGHLTEMFEKAPGEQRRLAVYPGRARLVRLDGGAPKREYPFAVASGGTVVLHTVSDASPSPFLGQSAKTLTAKGIGLKKPVQVTKLEPGVSFLLGAGYDAAFSHEKLLNPRHRFSIPLRIDIARFAVGLAPIYGFENRAFDAWQYRAHMAGGRVFGGYGWDLGPCRLGVELGLSVAHIWQVYDTGDKRQSWQASPNGGISLLWPLNRAVLAVHGGIGPIYLTGAGQEKGAGWYVSGSIGAAAYFRLF